MTVHTRNTIPVGQIEAEEPETPKPDTVRVSETVYIADGDSVAVMRIGQVPLILPVRTNNERPPRSTQNRLARQTDRAPAPPYATSAPLSLLLADEPVRRGGSRPSTRNRRPRYSETIVPAPIEEAVVQSGIIKAGQADG